MNTHASPQEVAEPVDEFAAWRCALETGKPVEYTKGQPTSGYFKRRARNDDRSIRWDAVAIWQEGGEWLCAVSAGYAPTHADEIEELFAACNASPISYELFMDMINGGAWPDEVAPVETAPDLEPHAKAAAELAEQQKAAKEWALSLKGAEGKTRNPATQAEADKAANFADAFGKLEKQADKLRTAEKEPHLEAGRAVDAKWKPTIDGASKAKVWAKDFAAEFAKAEAARRQREADAENARRQAEFLAAKAESDARAAREAALAAKGVAVPQFAPVPAVEPPKAVVAEPVRLGTGTRRAALRTVKTWEITDASAVLRFLAARNEKSADLLAAALKEARILRAAGIEVPGTEERETTGVV